jgi:hypothetical protein
MKRLQDQCADARQLGVHAAVRAFACPVGTQPFVHAWRKLVASRETQPERALEAMRRPFPLPLRPALPPSDPPSRLAAWDLNLSHVHEIREVLVTHLTSCTPCLASALHKYCAETGSCAACGDAVTVRPGEGVLLSTLVNEVRRCLRSAEWAQCPETLQCVVEDAAQRLLGQPSLRTSKDVLWGHVAISIRPPKQPKKRARVVEGTTICI